jgi:hypothetical protein
MVREENSCQQRRQQRESGFASRWNDQSSAPKASVRFPFGGRQIGDNRGMEKKSDDEASGQKAPRTTQRCGRTTFHLVAAP